MSVITIRDVDSDVDRQAVADLIMPIQREEFSIDITYEDQPDLVNLKEFYQYGQGGFWVACDGDEIVGSIALKDIDNKQAALRKMFVKPSHRGKEKGVAKALLAHLLAHAKDQAVKTIYLGTTPQFLAAHRFYEKNGFSLIDKADLPQNFPIMSIDNRFYFMKL